MALLLVPTPRQLQETGGHSAWPNEGVFSVPDPGLAPLHPALDRFLASAAALTGGKWQRAEGAFSGSSAALTHRIVLEPDLPAEGYRLRLNASGIHLGSADWRGAFYGLQTLMQILRTHPRCFPHLETEDAPARKNRGYLLDISRNKVPRRETLCALIDQLAALKYNQLQLYIEHTFAFPGHESVWGDASPLTPEDIHFLDTYAAERAIELVPNFNSFGHFERWLRHPDYFQYAECPYGWRRPDGHGMPWGSTLTPSAGTRTFLAGLYREYLPLFSSRQCNIGADEPWELGMGRSREACAERGRHAVYLDFLHEIVGLATEHKDRVQFWADIVLERPEIVPQLDPRLTAMVWGYEAGHPLESQAAHFAQCDLPFYLCPGTSTWNSLGTRLANARSNIERAGRAAETHGAEGLLLTDWGDNGHHQPAVLSIPAIFLAAQSGWVPEQPIENLEEAIAQFAFSSRQPMLASVLLRIGGIERHFDWHPSNRMPLVAVLSAREDQLPGVAAKLTTDSLWSCHEDLARLAGELADLETDASASLIREELDVTVRMLMHAVRRLLVHRRESWDQANRLRGEFTALIGRFEENWARRNHVGGLHESSLWFRRALATYPGEPPRRPAWPPTAWES